MKKLVLALALWIVGSIAFISPAMAGSAADMLITCMTDNTTGKDRKEIAQWVFVHMTSHPEIKTLSNVTDTKREEFDKKIAALVTKLITENCRTEAKSAMEKEGADSFNAAFGTLGKLAMQELMANPAVNSSFYRYTKYLDKAKFDAAFAKQ